MIPSLLRLFPQARLIFVAFAVVLVQPAAIGQSATQTSESIPKWFNQHMAFMTAGGGRWITDNTKYVNDEEPYQEYGLEWSWGIGDKSIKGKLFGLIEKKEVATFWEFRIFWHGGEKKAKVYQFGGTGIVGIGEMRSIAPGVAEMEQKFYQQDGKSFMVKHLSTDKDDTHTTISYDRDADGTWKEDRTYVWKRQ